MAALISRPVIWSLAALAAALTIWALYERVDAATARATLAERQLAQAEQREQQKALVIDALWKNASSIESQRRAADQRISDLTRLASNRLSAIEELQHENATLRDWARTRLPEPVIRLRQHPAYTGADAYYQSMRDAEPVHATGVQSAQ